MKRWIEINPDPEELALEFCKMKPSKRVDFLIEVAREVESYGESCAASWMIEMVNEIRDAGGKAEKLVRALASGHSSRQDGGSDV